MASLSGCTASSPDCYREGRSIRNHTRGCYEDGERFDAHLALSGQMHSLRRSGEWLLKVRVNGDWEQCRFSDSSEAVATLEALAKDYADGLSQARILRVTGPTRAVESALQLVN